MRVDTGRLRVVSAEAGAAAEGSAAASGSGSRLELGEAKQPEASESFESPGPYIRAQRLRRGMSLDQLAAATKIPRGQLELLEADRFEELPGMVFAKGFLRCCARALELDEDTVLGLLYERERMQLRQRRREASHLGPVDARQVLRPDRPSSGKRPISLLDPVRDYAARWLGQLPSGRILMWIVVALVVALIVFIAFTLASSQSQGLMIRS